MIHGKVLDVSRSLFLMLLLSGSSLQGSQCRSHILVGSWRVASFHTAPRSPLDLMGVE